MTNLISNAIKYGEGTPVGITVERDPASGAAILRVSDQGMGIPAELQPRLFQRFERAAPSHRIQGLGLGLYISSQIVQAHGGNLSVRSGDGKATVFTVELPPA